MKVVRGVAWLVLVAAAATSGCKGDDASADVGDPDVEGGADAAADADADPDVEPEGDVAGEDVEEEAEAVDPCPTYPCAPYGTELGEVIEDLALEPANTSAVALAGDDAVLDLHDFYGISVARGGDATALLIFVTSIWCPYCAVEADKLEALYQDLHPLGVEMLGLILDSNTPGVIANPAQARAYASRHGWTFPTVVVSPELYDAIDAYWPPADRASGSIGVPMHLFYDLREMRMYGRFAGAVDMNLLRFPLTAIAVDPQWESPGVRRPTLDCAPGTGTETESNDFGGTPARGLTLPYSLSGAICPADVGDELLFERDLIDLGNLDVGEVVEAEITVGAGAAVVPYAFLARVSTGSLIFPQHVPAILGTESNGRQWLIDRRAHYFLAVLDGRYQAAAYYGPALPVPMDDACCLGGPDETYDVTVASSALAVTDDAVTVGTSAPFALEDGFLNVHPFDAVAATSYSFRMEADADVLNPYLVVYDPSRGTILGVNDDEDPDAGNVNSLITATVLRTGTIWIVAGYTTASFRLGPPAYTIRIE